MTGDPNHLNFEEFRTNLVAAMVQHINKHPKRDGMPRVRRVAQMVAALTEMRRSGEVLSALKEDLPSRPLNLSGGLLYANGSIILDAMSDMFGLNLVLLEDLGGVHMAEGFSLVGRRCIQVGGSCHLPVSCIGT